MKNEIRKTNKQKRASMKKDDVNIMSEKACSIFLASNIYKEARTIMLYMPLGNETDTSLIIKTAFRHDKKVVFPVTDSESGIITPYYADSNTLFTKGAFSVSEPLGGVVVKKENIDVVLVPGIAFDKHGARIGFGKGCYDRFLNDMDVTKVGFCYKYQICNSLPADEHDIRMDYIITEDGLIVVQ